MYTVDDSYVTKNMIRDADLVFIIPYGLNFWPYYFYELLRCAITLTIIRRPIWKAPWVIRVIRLSGMCQACLERGLKKIVRGRPSGSPFFRVIA